MDIKIIYSIIILLTSIPMGSLLYKITKDEKNLIKYYFPSLIIIFIVLSTIFLFTSLKNGFTSLYFLIVLLTCFYLSKRE